MMAFELTNKVALITGGASGLGYHITKKLLKHGLRAVAVVDVDDAQGKVVQDEFNTEFGDNSCIYIKADVSDQSQIEDVFKQTTETFNQLDIVINNAAVIAELNPKKTIDINLGGSLFGTIFSIDTYLPKYKSGDEAVLINISSIAGLDPMPLTPSYCATKYAILGLSRSYGTKGHYDKTKVKVLTVCPGFMKTKMYAPKPETFNEEYRTRANLDPSQFPIQEPEFVADCLPAIIKSGENGSVWVIEGGKPAYEVEFKDRLSMRKC